MNSYKFTLKKKKREKREILLTTSCSTCTVCSDDRHESEVLAFVLNSQVLPKV